MSSGRSFDATEPDVIERIERIPKKPMVPTTTTQLAEYPPVPLRQHIGEPLGGEATGLRSASGERRKRKSWAATGGRRAMNDECRRAKGRARS